MGCLEASNSCFLNDSRFGAVGVYWSDAGGAIVGPKSLAGFLLAAFPVRLNPHVFLQIPEMGAQACYLACQFLQVQRRTRP